MSTRATLKNAFCGKLFLKRANPTHGLGLGLHHDAVHDLARVRERSSVRSRMFAKTRMKYEFSMRAEFCAMFATSA
jgi:hypothetical protein